MAHDLQDSKDVALKIMASGWEDREIAIQDEIVRMVPDTSRLVTYQDTFLLPEDPQDRVISSTAGSMPDSPLHIP